MSIRLAGEDIGIQEKIESIEYAPGLQDSGDLEPATKTITATSKQPTQDYIANLTIPATGDSRLSVNRLVLRLQLTIDSFGGGAITLNFSIEVNGVERLADSLPGTGVNYKAVDLALGQFNLGTANTIKIYLWVDQGNAVVSVAQVWLAVGSCATNYVNTPCVVLAHAGFVQLSGLIRKQGTGTPQLTVALNSNVYSQTHVLTRTGDYGTLANTESLVLIPANLYFAMSGSVATDANVLSALTVILRSLL